MWRKNVSRRILTVCESILSMYRWMLTTGYKLILRYSCRSPVCRHAALRMGTSSVTGLPSLNQLWCMKSSQKLLDSEIYRVMQMLLDGSFALKWHRQSPALPLNRDKKHLSLYLTSGDLSRLLTETSGLRALLSYPLGWKVVKNLNTITGQPPTFFLFSRRFTSYFYRIRH